MGGLIEYIGLSFKTSKVTHEKNVNIGGEMHRKSRIMEYIDCLTMEK